MRLSRQMALGLTATAAIVGIVVAAFPYLTDQPPEFTPSVKTEIVTHPASETSIPEIPPSYAFMDSHTSSLKNETSSQATRSGESFVVEPPPQHGTLLRFPEEAPYNPSIEELRRFNELKAKAYSPGMTLRELLMLEEYGTLPEPMRRQLFRDMVIMVMRGELNRQQFLEENTLY